MTFGRKKPQPMKPLAFKDLKVGELFRWGQPDDPEGLFIRLSHGTEYASLSDGQSYACGIADVGDPVIRVRGRIAIVAEVA